MATKTLVAARKLRFDLANPVATERWIRDQPSHATLTFIPKEPASLRDTYLDTEDWAIHRAGYSLRIRHGEACAATLEHLKSRRQQFGRSPLSDGDDGGKFTERVKLITGGGDLRSLFDVETNRHAFEIQRDGGTQATLNIDDSSVRRDGSLVRTMRRLSVEETTDGGLRQVASFLDALTDTWSLKPAAGSKFDAGLEATGLSPAAALDFGYAELTTDAAAGHYAYALLRLYFGELLRHEPGTRLGEDEEQLHEMRVTTRRLRSAIGLFGSVLPGRFVRLREELGWLGRTLGEVRDLDVYLAWLESEREASSWHEASAIGPLIADLATKRAASRQSLLDAFDSQRYAELISDITEALRQEEPGSDAAKQPIREFAVEALARIHAKWRKAARKLRPDSEPESYHRVRVLTKRLRYAADAVKVLSPKAAERLTVATKAGQDLLGDYQDCVVSIGRFEDAVEGPAALPPATVFRMGKLVEQQRQKMRELRHDWPAAFDRIRDAWKPLAKSLDEPADSDSADDTAPDTMAPRERPFWL